MESTNRKELCLGLLDEWTKKILFNLLWQCVTKSGFWGRHFYFLVHYLKKEIDRLKSWQHLEFCALWRFHILHYLRVSPALWLSECGKRKDCIKYHKFLGSKMPGGESDLTWPEHALRATSSSSRATGESAKIYDKLKCLSCPSILRSPSFWQSLPLRQDSPFLKSLSKDGNPLSGVY